MGSLGSPSVLYTSTPSLFLLYVVALSSCRNISIHNAPSPDPRLRMKCEQYEATHPLKVERVCGSIVVDLQRPAKKFPFQPLANSSEPTDFWRDSISISPYKVRSSETTSNVYIERDGRALRVDAMRCGVIRNKETVAISVGRLFSMVHLYCVDMID